MVFLHLHVCTFPIFLLGHFSQYSINFSLQPILSFCIFAQYEQSFIHSCIDGLYIILSPHPLNSTLDSPKAVMHHKSLIIIKGEVLASPRFILILFFYLILEDLFHFHTSPPSFKNKNKHQF